MTALRATPRAAGARIIALGTHRPARIVTNAEVCEHIDSTDEWIRDRSGIVTRRYAGPDEDVVTMAAEAGAKALAASGVGAEQIDLVIVATCTHTHQIPHAASEVATRLGIRSPGAFDISAACAGFCYALGQAADAVRAGGVSHVLVIGSEKCTLMVAPTDRTMAFIFGDGAGAAIVGPSDDERIGPVAWGSDGSLTTMINQRGSWADLRDQPGAAAPYWYMDGPAVFRWAVTQLAPIVRAACERAGVTIQDLAAFVPHQANLRIIESVAKSLRLPEGCAIARDIVDNGNTSSASIPLALARLVERGEVRSGEPALLVGFGAGMTYAAQVALVP